MFKNQRFKNMFPKFNKLHKMQTRNPLTFLVQRANTERLKNSAIIYMQRLLNNNVQKKWLYISRRKGDEENVYNKFFLSTF